MCLLFLERPWHACTHIPPWEAGMNRNHDPCCHEPTSKGLFTESWREGHREPSTPLYSASSEDSHRLSACVRAQSCQTLCDPMDCCPPGSPVSGIFQARILERVAISYSRGSSWPRVGSNLHLLSSYIGREIVYLFATWEAPQYRLLLLRHFSCFQLCEIP